MTVLLKLRFGVSGYGCTRYDVVAAVSVAWTPGRGIGIGLVRKPTGLSWNKWRWLFAGRSDSGREVQLRLWNLLLSAGETAEAIP